jgi:hypothetical protein
LAVKSAAKSEAKPEVKSRPSRVEIRVLVAIAPGRQCAAAAPKGATAERKRGIAGGSIALPASRIETQINKEKRYISHVVIE